MYHKKLDLEENPNLPFKNNFFDVVTMLAVFEHIQPDNLKRILKEIRRVLKPDGRFILTTPCPWSNKLLLIMSKFRLVSQEEIAEHKKYYPLRSVLNRLIEAGFSNDKIVSGYFEVYLNSWVYAEK